MNDVIIVLNSNWEIHQKVGIKTALSMIRRKVVEVIKYSEKYIISFHQKIQIPSIMKLINFVRKIYRTKVIFTKKNIYLRDRYTCGYCGKVFDKNDLSIDHIIPESRGGLTNWENCVTSCKKCNNNKDDKTPQEAKMFLKLKTYQPTISEFMKIKFEQEGLDIILNDLLEDYCNQN